MHTNKLNLRQKAKDERLRADVWRLGFFSPYLFNLRLNRYQESYGHDQ
jgi:hypothetical protein